MYSSVRAKHSRCTKGVNFAINAKNNPEKKILLVRNLTYSPDALRGQIIAIVAYFA